MRRLLLLVVVWLGLLAGEAHALPSYCALSGTILKATGSACASCKVTFRVPFPQSIGGTTIDAGVAATITTNGSGVLPSTNMAQTLYVGITVDKAQEIFVNIPSGSTADLSTLITPPVSVPASTNLNALSGILALEKGGTNTDTWTAGTCVQVNAGGTALESAAAACGSGGGGTPGGSNTQVQFNNAGAFGASADLTFTDASDALKIGDTFIDDDEVFVRKTGTGNGAATLSFETSGNATADAFLSMGPGAGGTLELQNVSGSIFISAALNSTSVSINAGTSSGGEIELGVNGGTNLHIDSSTTSLTDGTGTIILNAGILQGSTGGYIRADRVRDATSLPGTCVESELYQDNNSGGTEFYVCTAANTWTKAIAATDNVATATALAANGGNCSAGSAPLGVDTLGAVEGCFTVQASDADLDALAALAATAGFLARTGAGAFAVRTLTEGLAVDISNSTGAAGNPTIDFDPTEFIGDRTWANGGDSVIAWTVNLSGTDPIINFESGGVDVTGTIQQNNINVATVSTTQTLTNKTLTTPTLDTPIIADFTSANHTHASGSQGGALTSPIVNLTQSAVPVPTVEGRIEWDTNDDLLAIGNGATTSYAAKGNSAGAATSVADAELTALAGLSSPGYVAMTGAGTAALRAFVAGLAMDISNTNGTGDPTFDFDPTELTGNRTFGDGSNSTAKWTFNLTGAGADPFLEWGTTATTLNGGAGRVDLTAATGVVVKVNSGTAIDIDTSDIDIQSPDGTGQIFVNSPESLLAGVSSVSGTTTALTFSPTVTDMAGQLYGLKMNPVLTITTSTPVMAAVSMAATLNATVANVLSALDGVTITNVSRSATDKIPPFPLHDYVSQLSLQQTANGSTSSAVTVGFEALGGVNANSGDITVSDPHQSGYIPLTAADSTTERFTSTAHGFLTGDGPVYISTGNKLCTAASTPFASCSGAQAGSAALPAGVATRTSYWIIKIDVNTIQLAASYAEAIAGTAVNITTNGTPTNILGVAGTGLYGGVFTGHVVASAGKTASVDNVVGLLVGAPQISGAGTVSVNQAAGIWIREQAHASVVHPCALCSIGVSSPVKIAGKMQLGKFSDAGPSSTLEVTGSSLLDGAVTLWPSIPDVGASTASVVTFGATVNETDATSSLRVLDISPTVDMTAGGAQLTGVYFAPAVTLSASSLAPIQRGLYMSGTSTTTDASAPSAFAVVHDRTYTTTVAGATPMTTINSFLNTPTLDYAVASGTGATTTVAAMRHAPIIKASASGGTYNVTNDIAVNVLGTYTETAGAALTVTNRVGLNFADPTNTSSLATITDNHAVKSSRLTGATNNSAIDVFGLQLHKVDNTSTCTACTDADIIWNDSSFIRLTGNSAKVIGGIGGGADGRYLVLYNQGSGSLVIDDDDGSAAEDTPASQILTLTGADITCTGVCAISMMYDSGASRWFVTGINNSATP